MTNLKVTPKEFQPEHPVKREREEDTRTQGQSSRRKTEALALEVITPPEGFTN